MTDETAHCFRTTNALAEKMPIRGENINNETVYLAHNDADVWFERAW